MNWFSQIIQEKSKENFRKQVYSFLVDSKVFVKKVYNFLDIIIEFPQIDTLEHKVKGIRGFTLIKQVNVFYIIKEDKIILLDFFDNRNDPSKKRF
ncbi:MAG: hypothetical protein U9N51_02405 [Bacteroidota bacterium]|nr:hypothetical protein [Bacteroidota bacterium]